MHQFSFSICHKPISMFSDQTLAKRIETAQAQNQMDYADSCHKLKCSTPAVAIVVGSGAALYAGAESPLTQSFGLGFEGGDTIESDVESQIETLEEFFFSRGSAAYIEVANLADMNLTLLLGKRGYTVLEYSHVLGFNLANLEHIPSPLQSYRLAASEIEAAADAVAAGFLEQNIGEGDIPPDFRELFVVSLHTTGSSGFAVKLEGEIAGAGGITILNNVAMLSGASTQPKFRNRGIQKALIMERLRFAHEAGCDIAVVTTQPGTVSQSNMQAMNFEILYARTKFTKTMP
ncbi:MAG: GNAT family N-acetyltransferase [Ignavibacteria bacterium]|nr:GNAT family N-acetyltransferase [Ignavibacteria bacterium]